MIGHTIETPSRFSWGAVLFALAGLGFVAGAVAEKNPHLAVFAALPIGIAIALWRATSERMTLMVHEDRLEFIEPQRTVLFEEIRSAARENVGKSNEALLVSTDDVTIAIPVTADTDLAAFEAMLAERVAPRPQNEPHPDMANYVLEQRETFGAERVVVYTTRARPQTTSVSVVNRRGPAVCIAIVIVGIAWCFAPLWLQGKNVEAWYVGGVMALIALLVWIALLQRKKTAGKVSKKLADSCLVISPLGIAMIQGDVRGKLRWDEIRDVRRKGNNAGFQVTAANIGLFLVVEGSMVHVQNIYTAPLAEIESEIRRNL